MHDPGNNAAVLRSKNPFVSGVDPVLPWVMMMNGANCYGQDYTYLLSQLANRGYLAVAPSQFHPPQQGIDLSRGTAILFYSMCPPLSMHPLACMLCVLLTMLVCIMVPTCL